MAIDIAQGLGMGGARRGRRAVRRSARDRITIGVMVGVPLLVVGGLIWFPTIASVVLSLTNWDGIGGVTTAHWVGTDNYRQIATIYPPFWAAVRHNLIWLGVLAFVATPFGLLLAFRTVVFPALRPINIVILVVTVIEALRAFDIVYIINQGRNGLELLSVLVTDNIIGEASRIGYGSAIAVILIVISIVPIVVFVWNSFQEKQA